MCWNCWACDICQLAPLLGQDQVGQVGVIKWASGRLLEVYRCQVGGPKFVAGAL